MAYIELIGVPGSGKTTIATELMEEFHSLRPARRSLARTAVRAGRLNALGLPRGISTWLTIGRGFIPDAIRALKFVMECSTTSYGRALRRAINSYNLLVKARVCNAHPHWWIADQGFAQLLLTLVANNDIEPCRAEKWLAILTRRPYEIRLALAPSVNESEWIRRVRKSEKHSQQLRGEDPCAYLTRYLEAEAKLTSIISAVVPHGQIYLACELKAGGMDRIQSKQALSPV